MIKLFYDGTKLLSLKDINNNTPEIYICTSNRSAGKTTYFNRLVVNRFIKKHQKFMLLYRYKYELENCADKFFKDIQGLFFNDYDMTSKKCCKGLFYELYLNDCLCGYTVALNSSEQLKKYSHFFNDVSSILFDEFQSETNKYCSNEINKFISLHTSIARGNGKQQRYLPVYLIGNPVTLLNPYYTALNISSKISTNTKYLRGDGYVLEQGYNEQAKNEQLKSGFNKAFAKNNYIRYSLESQYLNDINTFIDKPTGKSRYLATLKFNDEYYALKEYLDSGIIYCDEGADLQFRTKLCITTTDHDINYIMLKQNNSFIQILKYYFEHGCLRFKNIKCKDVLLKFLSY